jgi:hypothetical protein
MTYKDVLSDLTNLLDRHKMIQTWGYGNLSDLVTPFKKEDKTGNATTVYDIDYPYAFLQPLQHSLSKGKVAYNFNLIMMEQCVNDSQAVINAQSDCQQYIQDVLAEIYYNYDQKYDFTLNSSLTPFKEKYDDTVSGMTANIQIEIPMILNDCIAPFAPKFQTEYIYVGEKDPQILGEEAGEDTVIAARDYYINPDSQWAINRFVPTATRAYRIEVSGFVRIVDGSTGTTVPSEPVIETVIGSSTTYTTATETIGWPTAIDQTEYRYFTSSWDAITIETTDLINFIALFDKPEVTKDVELKEVQIKFFIQ